MILFLFLFLLAFSCPATTHACVTVYNATTNCVEVKFPTAENATLVVPAGDTVTFEPTDEELQSSNVTVQEMDSLGNVIDSEPASPFSDGTALGYQASGVFLDTSATEKSAAENDSDLAGYFTSGLETGSALAATLMGFIVVRRALSLGDNWND
jgi:plastocyanin